MADNESKTTRCGLIVLLHVSRELIAIIHGKACSERHKNSHRSVNHEMGRLFIYFGSVCDVIYIGQSDRLPSIMAATATENHRFTLRPIGYCLSMATKILQFFFFKYYSGDHVTCHRTNGVVSRVLSAPSWWNESKTLSLNQLVHSDAHHLLLIHLVAHFLRSICKWALDMQMRSLKKK